MNDMHVPDLMHIMNYKMCIVFHGIFLHQFWRILTLLSAVELVLEDIFNGRGKIATGWRSFVFIRGVSHDHQNGDEKF